ncbi:hypothetical protein QOZ80_4BG0336560 [Eleusine coracana subsp. coracana]|nr:hypothetical protein QOZ80_4BG0336560 [Eleusine coracana subsp. coracana]
MKESNSHELVTDVPASELWKIYNGLGFVQLFHQLLPHVLQNIEVIRGDGSVGTVIKVTVLPPGNSSPITYTEEFVKIDNKNYVKETLAIEGEVLNLGFIKYGVRLEIIDKGPCSSVIKSSVVYEFDDGRPELEAAAGTTHLAVAARAIAEYLKKHEASEASC